MPKHRKHVILVFLVLLTSFGVLCLAIVTVMLMGRSLSNSSMASATTMASSTTMVVTPQELLVSSDLQQRFTVLSKASTDSCSNIGNRAAIDADTASHSQAHSK